tara:strand:+ start:459 stop:1205 length:747 start_codon:yes stop_codon:yes gene_type:complete
MSPLQAQFLTETPENKRFSALIASTFGVDAYVSGSELPDMKLSLVITNGASTNNTVGNDETLFYQFHAWVTGSHLYNSQYDDSDSVWIYSAGSGTTYQGPGFLSMSIQAHSERYFTHLNIGQNFEWQTGDEYPVLGGSVIFSGFGYDQFTVPYTGSHTGHDAQVASGSCWTKSYINPLIGTYSDIGGIRCVWKDHYNSCTDVHSPTGTDQYSFTDAYAEGAGSNTTAAGFIHQSIIMTHRKGGGGGSG